MNVALNCRRQLLCLSSLFSLFIVSACAEAEIKLRHDPRFVHKVLVAGDTSDPIPLRKSRYPGTYDAEVTRIKGACQGVDEDMFGYDFQLQYIKDETGPADDLPDDDERFFQILETNDTTIGCNGGRSTSRKRNFEYFHQKRNYDTLAYHECNKRIFSRNIQSVVGLIDLDDLEDIAPGIQNRLPNVNNGQNVAGLSEWTWVPARRDWSKVDDRRLWRSDIPNIIRARDSADDDDKMEWTLKYEYDGCNDPDDIITFCGRRHCWELVWSDSEVTNKKVPKGRD